VRQAGLSVSLTRSHVPPHTSGPPAGQVASTALPALPAHVLLGRGSHLIALWVAALLKSSYPACRPQLMALHIRQGLALVACMCACAAARPPKRARAQAAQLPVAALPPTPLASTPTGILSGDAQALLDFRAALTNGAEKLPGWSDVATVCDWEGVLCVASDGGSGQRVALL